MSNEKLIRAALYVRVSTDEQRIKGLSLDAQEERLREYAREQNWIITGVYVDAGKTARKNIEKREGFHNMLESVKRNEVDILLFCRLDRWFRSVSDYYKVMEILEKHHCDWKTIDDGEGYDTTTASGRLYINMKLSMAQHEADLDGERIAAVFDSKIKHGTVLSGACPFWLKIDENKRYEVIPEKADIVRDIFNYFEQTHSKRNTLKYIKNKYDLLWYAKSLTYILTNKLVCGIYEKNGRRNAHFCEPIITKEQFERVQEILSHNIRFNPTGRIYLFSSMLVCAECNHTYQGCYGVNDTYVYYRCNGYRASEHCTNKACINEKKLEEELLENLCDFIKNAKLQWDIEHRAQKTSKVDVNKIKHKMSKLKDLYVNDMIDLDEYKKDYEELKVQLEKATSLKDEKRPNFEQLERFLKGEFGILYTELSREDKRSLWHSIVRKIVINSNKQIVSVIFV